MTNQTADQARAIGFEAGTNYCLDLTDVDQAPKEWSRLDAILWHQGFESACEQYGEVWVVQNLMSGKDVVQSINTPLCCDVSSETYWCS